MRLNSKLFSFLRYIKHDVAIYYWYLLRNSLDAMTAPRIQVHSIEGTIQAIVENRLSVSRFGDGEFLWMTGGKQNSFQDDSEHLALRLREILKSSAPGHIVCLPDAFGSLREYNHFARRFWSEFMFRNRRTWLQLLAPGKMYYSTNISRMYFDYKDKGRARDRFALIRSIWEERDVVIVEGEQTRLGIGNDLFAGAKRIQRILAPSRNAFDRYGELLLQVQRAANKKSLILAALGPTATVLCYDLAVLGYQAVDIGHIDVEYEWMRMGASEKVPVKNKYVNEAGTVGRAVAELHDKAYQEQIICTIR